MDLTIFRGRNDRIVGNSAADTASVGLGHKAFAEMARTIDKFGEISIDAQQATEFERNMSLFQALRLYRKVAILSLILSASLVMEGYDTSLMVRFFAYPSFQRKFGVPVGDGTYQLTASWQSGLQAGARVGQIIGLWVAGISAERWGYRKTMLGALFTMILVIFIMFFAQNISMLLIGQILCGLPWGAFQTITTTYAAEISPLILRPYLTTFVNMCVSSSFFCGGRSGRESHGHFSYFLTILTTLTVGHGSNDLGWRSPRTSLSHRRMGLADPLCNSMGLADSNNHWCSCSARGEDNHPTIVIFALMNMLRLVSLVVSQKG